MITEDALNDLGCKLPMQGGFLQTFNPARAYQLSPGFQCGQVIGRDRVNFYVTVQDLTVMAPETAPDWVRDHDQLWNAVEAVEHRKDVQLAREIEVALPRELYRGA